MAESTNPIKYSDLVAPDDSITNLIKQLDELSDAYKNTLNNIKSEAIQVTASLNKVSGATEQGRQATRRHAEDADKLVKAYKEQEFAYSENAKKLAEIKQATKEQNDITKLRVKLGREAVDVNRLENETYNRLSAQYRLNKIYLNDMTDAQRKNTKEGKKLEEETRRIYEQMKRLQEATGKYQLNVGNYENAIQSALGVNNQFGKSLIALGKGGQEGRMAMMALTDGVKAFGKATLAMLTNPIFVAIAGVGAVATAFKFWYDYNTGIAEATRLTREFLNVNGEELTNIRSEIQSIADTYGKEYLEVLQTIDTISAQWGVSAQEALSIVERGFQSGADLSGDMLAKIKQFAPTFHDAGIGADELVALIQQTRSGIFSDRGMQIIEMASKRIREMGKATQDSLNAIGIDSKKITEELEKGTISTFDVIRMISERLSELPPNAQAVGDVLKDVFGKSGAGAGLELIKALQDIDTNLDNIKTKTGAYGQSLEELRQANERLDKAVASLFDATEGGFDVAINKAKIFATDALTGVLNILNGIKTAVQGVWQWFDSLSIPINKMVNSLVNAIPVIGKVKSLLEIVGIIGKTSGGGGKTSGGGGTTTTITATTPSVSGYSATPTATSASGGKKSGTKTDNTEQIYKANLQAVRKAQDAELALMKDGDAKKEQQIRYQYDRQIEDLKHQLATEKNLNADGRKAINDTIIALEKQKTEQLKQIQVDRELKQAQWEKEGINLRMQATKEGTLEELELRRELIKKEQEIALRQNLAKAKNEQQTTAEIIAVYEKQAQDLTEKFVKMQLDAFDAEQDLASSEFDLLRNSEERKTRFRLEQEKKRWQKILELNALYGGQLSDTEVATITNVIKKIDQEIERSKGEERGRDIYGLFGLNLDDDQKEAISTSTDFAIEQLNNFLDAKVQSAEIAVEASNKEVEASQRRLDAELEARANGYANNVEMAQKELENAKKTQEKALKEQEKAQKQQEAIQTLQQIGNLVTSTSLIWSQLGFPWAIPAIAVMWGSFATAKIKASQVAKESYGEGTIELLQGGSHQSGNDIDLGTKPNGTKRRAEGGEFFAVINKRNSRKYRKIIPDVINSLNDGSFASKYLNAYDGANGIVSVNVNASTDVKELNDNVREIKNASQRKVYNDGEGIVTEYKNLKRRIR